MITDDQFWFQIGISFQITVQEVFNSQDAQSWILLISLSSNSPIHLLISPKRAGSACFLLVSSCSMPFVLVKICSTQGFHFSSDYFPKISLRSLTLVIAYHFILTSNLSI